MNNEKIKHSFFMPMRKVPTATHQQTKVTKTGLHYKPDNVLQAERLFLDALAPNRLQKPIMGPIRLLVKWCFEFDATHTTGGEWKTTKPDIDNSQKLLQDCMTKLKFWKDDAQIVSLIAEKFWNDTSGIYIEISELA